MNDKMEQSAKNVKVDAGQDRVFQVTNKVFGVDLLLDMILDNLIHDDEDKMTVQNCRLVSKAWRLSINRIYRKSEKPLFVFYLHEYLEVSPIDQFLKSVSTNVHLDELAPPYAIKGGTNPSFFNCLSNCGSGLIQLDLEISKKLSDHQVSLTNNFLLPRLSKFTFYLLSSSDPSEESSVMDKIKFIQTIFDASKQLKSVTLFNFLSADNYATADCFGSLLFPSSITHLNFRSPNESQIEALLNSSLPNLKTLKIPVNQIPIKKGLITSVLQKVKKTLQTIYVFDRGIYSPGLRRTTSFQLPLMEKLKELYIDTAYFELEGGHCSSLQQQPAPVLEKVTLFRQTRSMLRKWTDLSCFPNVTSLNVSMIGEDIRQTWNSFANFDLVTMQALHLAFPMVKELTIRLLSSTDMTAFLFLMREMNSLRSLRITVSDEDRLQSSDIWDAVLIGIPQESVGALRESPDLWEGLQVGNDVSIRNLTELQTLELTSHDDLNQCPFITEMAFQYAFLKMPTLTNLTLKGGFSATMEMREMWKGEGRTINTDIFFESDEQVSDSESSDEIVI